MRCTVLFTYCTVLYFLWVLTFHSRYSKVQHTLFSPFQVLYTKCAPIIIYSTPNFPFSSTLHQNAYLLYSTVQLIFPFWVLYTKLRTCCTLEYTRFKLFQALYTKCAPTIPYSTPYFPFLSNVNQNAYLM